MALYNIKTKSAPTFYFIGVTTGKSSINKVFPLWMEVLGHPDVVIEASTMPYTMTLPATAPRSRR